MKDVKDLAVELEEFFKASGASKEDIMLTCIVTGGVYAEELEVPFEVLVQILAKASGIDNLTVKMHDLGDISPEKLERFIKENKDGI